jgi:hypothetical protein
MRCSGSQGSLLRCERGRVAASVSRVAARGCAEEKSSSRRQPDRDVCEVRVPRLKVQIWGPQTRCGGQGAGGPPPSRARLAARRTNVEGRSRYKYTQARTTVCVAMPLAGREAGQEREGRESRRIVAAVVPAARRIGDREKKSRGSSSRLSPPASRAQKARRPRVSYGSSARAMGQTSVMLPPRYSCRRATHQPQSIPQRRAIARKAGQGGGGGKDAPHVSRSRRSSCHPHCRAGRRSEAPRCLQCVQASR